MNLLLAFDTSALSVDPSPRALRAYRRRTSTLDGPALAVTPCFGGVAWTTVLVVLAGLTAFAAVIGAGGRVVAFGAVLATVSALCALVCARQNVREQSCREYRLASFAARNGLHYQRGDAGAAAARLLAESGHEGSALRHFHGTVGAHRVEIGNYRRPAGAGARSSHVITGYVLLQPAGVAGGEADGRLRAVAPFRTVQVERVGDAVLAQIAEPFDFANPDSWRQVRRMLAVAATA